MVVINEDDYLAHYGTPRRSGRYPWGSGEQSQKNASFLDHVDSMKKQGLSEGDIAKGVGMSIAQLRASKTIAKNEQQAAKIIMIERLAAKGYSNGAIAERMGLPGESSVRALRAPGLKDKADILTTTSAMIKSEVDAKKFVDVGVHVEKHLGISQDKLRASVEVLKQQGYVVHTYKLPQPGTGFETNMKILCPPGTTWGEARKNADKVQQLDAVSADGGRSFTPKLPPKSINPKRVGINYAEDGGAKADGVIYVREGVKDVSLGKNRYAQVRIQVGNGHYLKGMAMYKDDLPDGVDLLFNTAKHNTGNKFDAMKPLKADADLPFGAVVRQIVDKPGHPSAKVTSVMNIVNDEGDWGKWSRNISAQALSKQSPKLAKTQLDMTHESRRAELDAIKSLTNPTVKKKLLESFADGTDAAAVHLKAAALERQNWRVILPIKSLKPTEIYAPTFRDGERVALIRYPHGGTFEIPELTVNNRHRESKKILGDTRTAVGIHHTVAEHLSGADFDGDTVLVIPNNKGKIKTTSALQQLKGFDPKAAFPPYHGMKTMDGGTWNEKTQSVDYHGKKPSSKTKGQEMGQVSNLITDMTIKGASHEQIARAVKHSMVVIDAEKHSLNYKQSAIDNNIKALKMQYQGTSRSGASTLISRATSDIRVFDRKPRPQKDGGPIDKVTGKRVFVPTGKRHADGSLKKIKSQKLAETDDAHTLLSSPSGTPMEKLYADHSNKLKAMANEARLEYVKTPNLKYDRGAKQTYSAEVASLNAKLTLAQRNAPRERQALVIANATIKAKRDANPDLDVDSMKKIKYQALEDARTRVGAKKDLVVIEPKEWDAIQAGAISNDKLEKILMNTDVDKVKELAAPRNVHLMTSAKTNRAQAMLANGFTRAEVADQLGVSISTLDAATSGVEVVDDE